MMSLSTQARSSSVVATDDGDDASNNMPMPSSPGSYVAHYPNGTVTYESENINANGARRIVTSTYINGHRVKKTETVIVPNMPSSADNMEEDDDNTIDWSPQSAQSVPSLLGDVAFSERSGSELTDDPAIIETSSSMDARELLMPQLEMHPEISAADTTSFTASAGDENDNGTDIVGPTTPLRRFSTPPSRLKTSKQDETVGTASPSPPSTPSTRPSSLLADDTTTAAQHVSINMSRSSLEQQRETERKKNLKIKNWLRRLAKGIRNA